MTVINVVRFYRLGATQFVLVQGLPRSGGKGYRTDESWATASGKFNDPTSSAMSAVKSVWVANKAANDATLTSLVNTALTSAGFTRPDGSVIT